MTASSPIFRRCRFEDNQATANDQASGAALSIWGHATPVIQDCVFRRNRAQRGGGAIGFYGSSRSPITGCIFIANEALLVGGGDIECGSLAAPRISRSTFYGGSAPAGGALSLKDRAHPVLERSIIAHCAAGEAIECKDTAAATLRCCDLYGNAGGDWVGCLAEQFGTAGNVSVPPDFAAPERDDLSLAPRSALRKLADCGALGAGRP